MTPKHNILIIDDDIYIGDMLEEILAREGYGVMRAYSGTEAVLLLESCKNIRPDLILLDLMLPGLSGEEILPKIKGIPVIVVSAKAALDDKVELLLGGAADYITKPFESRELLARIVAQLRKTDTDLQPDGRNLGQGESNTTAKVLRFRDLAMSLPEHKVTVAGKPVRLTKTEYAILKILIQNPSGVVTKSVLLDRISEDTPDCMESSLKVHVSNLRRKLREAGGSDREYIEAVWGIGFKMKTE